VQPGDSLSPGRERAESDAAAVGSAPYAGIVERSYVMQERSAGVSYLAAFMMSAAAIGLRSALDLFGDGFLPFALFYPVLLAATLFGGAGPGLLALAMCALAGNIMWMEPFGGLAPSGPGLVNTLLFAVSGGVIIGVANWLRATQFDLRRSEERLRLSQAIGRIGIWELDIPTNALWWSPSMYDVTGIAPDVNPSVEAFIGRISSADRPRAAAAFDAARRGTDRLDTEVAFERSDGTVITLACRAELIRDSAGRPSRLLGINFDATAIRLTESERDAANTLLRTFFDSLPGAAYAKDTAGRILLANPHTAAAFGLPLEAILGKTALELAPDEAQARAVMAHDRAVLEAGTSQQSESDFVLPDGRPSHWLTIKTPFRNARGIVQGIVGISLDVTQRYEAQKRLRFLADEVDHRAKNLLGVVQSIVRLTRGDDATSLRAALTGRIQALATAHNLLAASRWEGVVLSALVEQALAPFRRIDRGRVAWSGPALKLGPSASQALAMVLHELATNAAKYGALSVEAGTLDVNWQLIREGDAPSLALHWSEAGGPPVTTPIEPGFGTSAIRGLVEHQLGGQIQFAWAPDGLQCRIVLPLDASMGETAPRSAGRLPRQDDGGAPGAGAVADLTGKRVLVVEGETLIAMTLKDEIEAAGGTTVGPAANAAAALALIREGAPDLAILCVTLAGASSTPVARALDALNVPFIYCTGHAEAAAVIEGEYLAEIVTKPIDPDTLTAALRRALAARAEG
jgi:PAS domain S-box-containing protein